ncbi:histidine phosphatase family protein [Galbibacter sp. EGI 63066]|uniref:SixA phosphatase family protein n=1 Tax=Galbibacter sp. EGI 63066 TaxID=2993559 RepID=UPI0022487937|nr:histidine phosphatase family protein [Galbibacter sp. EGI 63066]MCX2680896.1 histidine phosphatase family protein [Galbibacter sp. EGI 63066]
MKTLTLVRHGKSSWDYDVSDKDRPLKQRGINDAILVSNAIKKDFAQPDAVFSSPANRALHTCAIFMQELGFDLSKLTVTDALYDFGGSSVIDFIKHLDESYKNIMIFGHNHAFTSISNIFGNKSIDNLSTSGLVSIRFDANRWADIDKGITELIIFPKQLK